jgi:hypothetical protein
VNRAVPLSMADRLEIVERCTRKGETALEIAFRIGMSQRQVQRYRRILGISCDNREAAESSGAERMLSHSPAPRPPDRTGRP